MLQLRSSGLQCQRVPATCEEEQQRWQRPAIVGRASALLQQTRPSSPSVAAAAFTTLTLPVNTNQTGETVRATVAAMMKSARELKAKAVKTSEHSKKKRKKNNGDSSWFFRDEDELSDDEGVLLDSGTTHVVTGSVSE